MRLSPLYTLMLTALLGSAHAAVTIYTDDVELQQHQQQKQFFSQSGLSPEQADVIPGAGDEMPLSLVSSIVIPKNWKIEGTGNYDARTVSWSGGISWPQILRDIAQREEIFVSLDWIKKVATIHVPGAKSQLAQAGLDSAQEAREAQNAFQAREDLEKFEKRSRVEARANNSVSQLDVIMTRNRESQLASQELVEKLNKRNQQAIEDNAKLQEMLEKERAERVALEDRFKVIDPTLGSTDNTHDATELFAEHQSKWVLPFDSSFDYYIKGGHADLITMETPATYIAYSGTIEEVVTQWCAQVGCFVDYRAGVQHYNPYEVELKGSFHQATAELISTFEKSARPLKIDIYPDVRHQGKQGLVVISDLNFKKTQ